MLHSPFTSPGHDSLNSRCRSNSSVLMSSSSSPFCCLASSSSLTSKYPRRRVAPSMRSQQVSVTPPVRGLKSTQLQKSSTRSRGTTLTCRRSRHVCATSHPRCLTARCNTAGLTFTLIFIDLYCNTRCHCGLSL